MLIPACPRAAYLRLAPNDLFNGHMNDFKLYVL